MISFQVQSQTVSILLSPSPTWVCLLPSSKAQSSRQHFERLELVFPLQDQPPHRFEDSFKKMFREQEVRSLKQRTCPGTGGVPECACLVAVGEVDGQEKVLATLDMRPPASLGGRPPMGVPQVCTISSLWLKVVARRNVTTIYRQYMWIGHRTSKMSVMWFGTIRVTCGANTAEPRGLEGSIPKWHPGALEGETNGFFLGLELMALGASLRFVRGYCSGIRFALGKVEEKLERKDGVWLGG